MIPFVHFCFGSLCLLLFQKFLLKRMSWGISSVFSCGSSIVQGLRFKSLIHFALIFVYGERQGSSFILLHTDIQFSLQHSLKRQSFPSACSWYLYQKWVHWKCVELFLGSLFYVSVLCWYHAVLVTIILQYNLK